MADVLIRDVDEALLARLKEQAAREGRSLQSELHQILESAAQKSLAEFEAWSSSLHERLKHIRHTDSAQLVREDRDR